MNSEEDQGASFGSGSRPSDQAASHLAPAGFDPSRDCSGLVKFAKQVLHASWDLADIDGSDIQEWAVRYGLLTPEPYDPEKHGPNDYDAEPGDTWLVYAGPLAPGIEARSAEAEGLGLKGESPSGSAGAPKIHISADELAEAEAEYLISPSPNTQEG